MLPKKHRLNKSSEVKKTTLKGRSFFNPFLVIKVLPGLDKVRLTVIVSVKVSKKAVVRNRIKRIIRNYIQKNLTSFKTGDYAIIVKPSTSKISEQELLENLKNTLIKGKIINI